MTEKYSCHFSNESHEMKCTPIVKPPKTSLVVIFLLRFTRIFLQFAGDEFRRWKLNYLGILLSPFSISSSSESSLYSTINRKLFEAKRTLPSSIVMKGEVITEWTFVISKTVDSSLAYSLIIKVWLAFLFLSLPWEDLSGMPSPKQQTGKLNDICKKKNTKYFQHKRFVTHHRR